MSKSTLPCIDCICLAMCKNKPLNEDDAIGVFLAGLSGNCSTIFEYFNLYDLGSNSVPVDSNTHKNLTGDVIVAVSKRILEICTFMGWKCFDLEKFKPLAQGIFPKDKTLSIFPYEKDNLSVHQYYIFYYLFGGMHDQLNSIPIRLDKNRTNIFPHKENK